MNYKNWCNPQRRAPAEDESVIEDFHAPDLVVRSRLRWVRMAHYCQATGDTPNAVHARRKKRQWLDGVQCKIAPDGNVWINIDEVNRWVESRGQEAAT